MTTDFKTKTLFDCLNLTAGTNGLDFEIMPASSETAIKKIIENYVEECDRIFEEHDGEISGNDLFNFWVRRFISFDEFLEVHILPLQFDLLEFKEIVPTHGTLYDQYRTRKEEPNYYFENYLNYYFLNIIPIKNELDFIRFKKNYTPTIQSYLNLLQESKAFKLQSFFFKETRPFVIPTDEREKHCYITGGAGSGKSELLKSMIFQDIIFSNKKLKIIQGYLDSYSNEDSRTKIKKYSDLSEKLQKNLMAPNVILIDPHGDLAEGIFNIKMPFDYRNTFFAGNNIIYFDPFLSSDKTPCINPFELSKEDQTEENIDRLSSHFAKVFDEVIENSTLSVQMQAILTPCIATLLRKGNTDLAELQQFMNDNKNAELVELGKKSPNGEHAKFFRDSFYNTTYSTTKNSLYTKLQIFLNSSNFSKIILGKSTINLKQILNEETGKVIIFSLSKGRLGNEITKLFGRLLLTFISSIAFNRSEIKDYFKRIPCYLYIDECQNFISESLFEGLAELRKYRFCFHLANQIVGQDMTAREKELLLSNTNIKFVGKNAVKSLRILALETGSILEDLQSLKTGEFFLKIGTKEGFTIKVPPTLLHFDSKISKQDFEIYKSCQLEAFYKQPIKPKEYEPEPERKKFEDKPKTKFNEKTAGIDDFKPMFDDDF